MCDRVVTVNLRPARAEVNQDPGCGHRPWQIDGLTAPTFDGIVAVGGTGRS